MFQANEERVHFRRPFPIWTERTKRDQNKYFRYHRDVGHDTNDCHELKDEIEDLIHQGKLDNYVRAPSENQAHSQSPRPQVELPPPLEVQGDIGTVYGGPHIGGDLRRAQDRYAWEVRTPPLTNVHHLAERPPKSFKKKTEDITFTNAMDDGCTTHTRIPWSLPQPLGT